MVLCVPILKHFRVVSICSVMYLQWLICMYAFMFQMCIYSGDGIHDIDTSTQGFHDA